MKKRQVKILILSGVALSLGGIFYVTNRDTVTYSIKNTQIEKYSEEVSLPLVQATEEYRMNKDFELVPNDKKGNRKVVLLTIDDGPTKRTPEVIQILRKHNIKAVFFINGIHDKDAPGVIKEIYDAGFSIGNHTWSHKNLRNEKKNDIIEREITTNSDLIKKITGTPPRFFRPPYGMSTAFVRELVKRDNMLFMNWSGSAKDWERSARNEKIFLSNVVDSLHPGEIILIHERPWTVQYLDTLLFAIKQEGYTFIDPSQITGPHE